MIIFFNFQFAYNIANYRELLALSFMSTFNVCQLNLFQNTTNKSQSRITVFY